MSKLITPKTNTPEVATKPVSNKPVLTQTQNVTVLKIEDTLSFILEQKKEIQEITVARNINITKVIDTITTLIKELRESNEHYKVTSRKTLIKVIKLNLGDKSKDGIVNVACNILTEGLQLDTTLSLSTLKYVIKCFDDVKIKAFSKNAINKADKELTGRKKKMELLEKESEVMDMQLNAIVKTRTELIDRNILLQNMLNTSMKREDKQYVQESLPE